MRPFQQFVLLSILLAASACASKPEYWDQACAEAATPERITPIEPNGLALTSFGTAMLTSRRVYPSDGDEYVEYLTRRGATWIEVNYKESIAPRAPSQNSDFERVFGEGSGMYRIQLAEEFNSDCRAALKDFQIDPKTLQDISGEGQTFSLGARLFSCLTGERTGEGLEESLEPLDEEALLDHWTAPYVAYWRSERDPRASEKFIGTISTYVVVDRESGKPVYKRTALSVMYEKPRWFPSIGICDPAKSEVIFSRRVTRPA